MKKTALVVMTCLAVGCSSAETPPAETSAPASAAASAPRDACTLITAEEASKILGAGVTTASRSTTAERSVCDYVPAGGANATAFQSFTLEAIWNGAEEEIKTARSAAKKATGMAGGRQDEVVADVMGLYQVDGLGDEAYFSRRTMSFVRKGGTLLVFQVAGLDEPARKNWEALARAALAKL